MPDTKKTTCFVVIPYGKKPLGPGGKIVDFERVFIDLIVNACHRLPDWNIAVERAKDDPTSGIVSERFINDILTADLCIVDITGANPNVFYELGLRHAFANKTTILIGGENSSLPFDIQGISCLWYNLENEKVKIESLSTLAKGIDKALKAANADSPVYKFLPDLRVGRPSQPCKFRQEVLFRVNGAAPEARVGIVTGALNDISGIDIWVNPENTEMEMARVMDRSISSVVRYWGAKRSPDGRVSNDLIQKALRKKMGSRTAVPPATVLDTEPGELKHKGVRQLLHVATVIGQPGRGYRAVEDLGHCVQNVLARVTELNRKAKPPLRSILLPLFGAGEGRRSLTEIFPEYLDVSIDHLKSQRSGGLQKIVFLAYTQAEYDFLYKTMSFHGALAFESDATREADAGAKVTETATSFIDYIDLVLQHATVAKEKINPQEELKHLHKAVQIIEATNWRQRFDEGAERAQTLIEVGRRVSDVYGRTGGVYRKMAKVEDALHWLKTGAAIEASDERFHRFTYNSVNRIVLELVAGRLSSLEQRHAELSDLQRRLQAVVSAERKSDAWAWADLAVINALMGRLEESTGHIETSLSLSPHTWPSLRYTLDSLAAAEDVAKRSYIIGLNNILESFDSRMAPPN